jgi:hypothetical protein
MTWDLKFPRLFSFAKDKLQSLKDFFLNENTISNFYFPLSVEAHEELIQLHQLVLDTHLNGELHDEWICTLGSGSAGFRPSLVYNKHFQGIDNHSPSVWIWKSKCTSK